MRIWHLEETMKWWSKCSKKWLFLIQDKGHSHHPGCWATHVQKEILRRLWGWPLVVTMSIDQSVVKRISIDTSSSINILFRETFNRWTSHGESHPMRCSLVRIYRPNCQVWREDLPSLFCWRQHNVIEFFIVLASSACNGILGRLALNQLYAKVSTCNIAMEIPNGKKFRIIYGYKNSIGMLFYHRRRGRATGGRTR